MKIKLSRGFKKDLTRTLEILTLIVILLTGSISLLYIGYIAQIMSNNSFNFVTDIVDFSELFMFANFIKVLMTFMVGIIAVTITTLSLYITYNVVYFFFYMFKNIFSYLKENIIVHEEEKLPN